MRNSKTLNSVRSTNVILKTYSGEKLDNIGKLPVVIEHNSEVHNQLFIYVVKGTGSTLLGRDLLTKIKLNWFNVNHVKRSLNVLLLTILGIIL